MTENTVTHRRNDSYLKYLPEIYQNNHFLEGYLALLQQLYEEMETAIDHSDRLYDAEICPPQFLEWLGGWLGLERLSQWPPDRLRMLIRSAPELYAMRGTVEGLARLLSLYCEAKFYFIEGCHTMRYTTDCPELARIFGGSFSLWVLIEGDVDDRQLGVLRELLTENMPAFAEAHICVLKPSLVLGEYSFLGVNSVLSDMRPGRLDGGSLYYTFLGGESG